MKKIFLALLILTTTTTYSQILQKEFEGVITYKTTIILKDKTLNIDELYKVFGRERQYYFKAGQFKWVPVNVKLEYEIFNPYFSHSIIIDKYHSSDTLFYRDMSKISDTVTSFKKGKELTVLNILCYSATFTVTDETKPSSKIFRTIYYPLDSLKYTTPYFDHYKATGQSFISRYTNSIPLRMELDSEDRPFSIVYEATNLEWKKLSDSDFQIDEKLPAKK